VCPTVFDRNCKSRSLASRNQMRAISISVARPSSSVVEASLRHARARRRYSSACWFTD
jgi:hypothetical protein